MHRRSHPSRWSAVRPHARRTPATGSTASRYGTTSRSASAPTGAPTPLVLVLLSHLTAGIRHLLQLLARIAALPTFLYAKWTYDAAVRSPRTYSRSMYLVSVPLRWLLVTTWAAMFVLQLAGSATLAWRLARHDGWFIGLVVCTTTIAAMGLAMTYVSAELSTHSHTHAHSEA